MTPLDYAPAAPVAVGADAAPGFAEAVMAGLSSRPKSLPCKFFYDLEGSNLFEKICDLPEYYPTRTEISLLERHAGAFAELIGPDAELVEFGAGSGRKVRILLDALARPRAYVPIDISGDFLRAEAALVARDYPALSVRPFVADFMAPLTLPPSPDGESGRRIGFFPGGTIGNLTALDAQHFLGNAARLLHRGAMLIGVDLVKDPAILHAAYNDRAGITAAFNRNLLVRANLELGADFEPERFAHHACYNPARQRIEMYLISRVRQVVHVLGHEISFAEGEAIHTENSQKYTIDGFRSLAAKAGFSPRAVWADPERLFSLHWLEAI